MSVIEDKIVDDFQRFPSEGDTSNRGARLLTPLGTVGRSAALLGLATVALFGSFTGDFVSLPSRIFAFLCPFALGLVPVVVVAGFVRRVSFERKRPVFLAALTLYLVALGYRSVSVASRLGISGPPLPMPPAAAPSGVPPLPPARPTPPPPT